MGREFWSRFVQDGGTLDRLRALLYGSEEYKSHLAKVYVARAVTAALASVG